MKNNFRFDLILLYLQDYDGHVDAYEQPEHTEKAQTETYEVNHHETHEAEHDDDHDDDHDDIHEDHSIEHISYADQPSRPHHMTKSYVHHEELPPIAAKLVHDNQDVPSEAT